MRRREEWDQRFDEPDAAYFQFAWWRDQSPRPPPSDPLLASQFNWADRALAYDQTQACPDDLVERVKQSVELGSQVVWRELAKLNRRSATSEDPVFDSPEKLGRFAERIVGLPRVAAGLPSSVTVQLPEDTPNDVLDAILRMRDFLLPAGED